jgi:hypothetical protein
MGWQEVTPSDEVDVADWIGPRLLPFREARIGSVIPTGFESYVRVNPHVELAYVLRQHTSTPGRCWFCLWEGYGYLTGSVVVLTSWRLEAGAPLPGPPVKRIPPPKLQKSRVRLPYRDYLLFSGAVEQGDGWQDGPNVWWPDDRAWCVASEIDLDYTLVGGSVELCVELVRDGAAAVSPEDRN